MTDMQPQDITTPNGFVCCTSLLSCRDPRHMLQWRLSANTECNGLSSSNEKEVPLFVGFKIGQHVTLHWRPFQLVCMGHCLLWEVASKYFLFLGRSGSSAWNLSTTLFFIIQCSNYCMHLQHSSFCTWLFVFVIVWGVLLHAVSCCWRLE